MIALVEGEGSDQPRSLSDAAESNNASEYQGARFQGSVMNRANTDGDDLVENIHDLFTPAHKVADLDLVAFQDVIKMVALCPAIHGKSKLG